MASARRDPERRMNAVLLLGAARDLEPADRRERGYDRYRVDDGSLTRHGDGTPLELLGSACLYVGKPDLYGRDVLPNPEYLRICLEGAREWGEDFYEDFLRTTFLCDGRTLEEFVEDRGSAART